MQSKALAVVRTNRLQLGDQFYPFHRLGNYLNVQCLGHADHRLDNQAAHRWRADGPDQVTIHLQIMHRQLLQIAEGRHTAAEIIQRKSEAMLGQLLKQLSGQAEIADGHGLGDFETDISGQHPRMGRQDRQHIIDKTRAV